MICTEEICASERAAPRQIDLTRSRCCYPYFLCVTPGGFSSSLWPISLHPRPFLPPFVFLAVAIFTSLLLLLPHSLPPPTLFPFLYPDPSTLPCIPPTSLPFLHLRFRFFIFAPIFAPVSHLCFCFFILAPQLPHPCILSSSLLSAPSSLLEKKNMELRTNNLETHANSKLEF